eukprot:6422010-Pyramimonas_sp.AAC.3
MSAWSPSFRAHWAYSAIPIRRGLPRGRHDRPGARSGDDYVRALPKGPDVCKGGDREREQGDQTEPRLQAIPNVHQHHGQ